MVLTESSSLPVMDTADSMEDGKRALLRKGNCTPGPGNYAWRDDVYLRKQAVYSMGSPDRAQLDMLIGTWTPASSTLQPRAPDPGEYGDQSIVGKNGRFGAPKWSYERGSIRPCLQPLPPAKTELALRHLPTCGVKHPILRGGPRWSVYGKDRSALPPDVGTWTPKMNIDIRPGPGQYKVDRPNRKTSTRGGCTFGVRTLNLHPDERAWVPQTFGSRLCGGSLPAKPRKVGQRCGCVVCPGPAQCEDDIPP